MYILQKMFKSISEDDQKSIQMVYSKTFKDVLDKIKNTYGKEETHVVRTFLPNKNVAIKKSYLNEDHPNFISIEKDSKTKDLLLKYTTLNTLESKLFSPRVAKGILEIIRKGILLGFYGVYTDVPTTWYNVITSQLYKNIGISSTAYYPLNIGFDSRYSGIKQSNILNEIDSTIITDTFLKDNPISFYKIRKFLDKLLSNYGVEIDNTLITKAEIDVYQILLNLLDDLCGYINDIISSSLSIKNIFLTSAKKSKNIEVLENTYKLRVEHSKRMKTEFLNIIFDIILSKDKSIKNFKHLFNVVDEYVEKVINTRNSIDLYNNDIYTVNKSSCILKYKYSDTALKYKIENSKKILNYNLLKNVLNKINATDSLKVKIKPGKFINKVYYKYKGEDSNKFLTLLNDSFIDDSINKFMDLKIVSGYDIAYYYNIKNYSAGNEKKTRELVDTLGSSLNLNTLLTDNPFAIFDAPEANVQNDLGGGSLYNSCMRYDECSLNRLDFYCQNKKYVKMLVHTDSKNKIKGRCIIWTGEDGNMYFDRLYTSTKESRRLMYDWLILNKYRNISTSNRLYPNTLDFSKNQEIWMKLEKTIFKSYPYMDSLKVVSVNKSAICKSPKGTSNDVSYFAIAGNYGLDPYNEYSDKEIIQDIEEDKKDEILYIDTNLHKNNVISSFLQKNMRALRKTSIKHTRKHGNELSFVFSINIEKEEEKSKKEPSKNTQTSSADFILGDLLHDIPGIDERRFFTWNTPTRNEIEF